MHYTLAILQLHNLQRKEVIIYSIALPVSDFANIYNHHFIQNKIIAPKLLIEIYLSLTLVKYIINFSRSYLRQTKKFFFSVNKLSNGFIYCPS